MGLIGAQIQDCKTSLKSFLDSYLVMMGHKVPKKDDHSLHSAFCQQLVCSTMSISA